MQAKWRLMLSAGVALLFYGSWAYWVNSSPSIATEVSLRSAVVQGGYSGLMTLIFTLILENSANRFNNNFVSLALITPFICSLHHQTKRNKIIFNALNTLLNRLAKATRKPRNALYIAPLLPLSIQAFLVILVNYVNQTPNLLLTVLPSILFSAVYGYAYLFSFFNQQKTKP